MITANQLRHKYLDFFANRKHAVVPSSLLIPENDPTTLFTTAGMQPMMPFLLGEEHPVGKRITNSQKCFRAQDIEEVGDNRHTTFFEMLGNWSLGDYFKKEQLEWFFQFLIDEVGLPVDKLFVTVFAGSEKYGIESDQESALIWQELFSQRDIDAGIIENAAEGGIDKGRIFYYPADKNWWSRAGNPDDMPLGEIGGPDSEVFYDFGPEFKYHENSEFAQQPCHPNCECGRFLEIGNSVFMQYQKTQDGFKELPQKNIDFGGGLERILAATKHQPDIFKTELFWPILEKVVEHTGQKYIKENKKHFRVIADHLKAAVMLINDNVKPSNKDQGYMVRRLLRRSLRHWQFLNENTHQLSDLVLVVAGIYQQPFPKLFTNQEKIKEIVSQEIGKFEITLEKGLKKFNQLTSENQKLTGVLAYDLYQTYGFPLEMSIEEAKSRKIKLDKNLEKDFNLQKKLHIKVSKRGVDQRFKGGLANSATRTIAYHTATHLLHAALREVLGEHVIQKGSHITEKRLRFDFSHPKAVDRNELKKIENMVNNWIKKDLPVIKKTMDKNKAIKAGALAAFLDKYSETVDVYQIGQDEIVSQEICGGPHVDSTGEIEEIEIFKEKSASAGVRRVYLR